MTATYEDRTQEGFQIQLTTVARLLGWDEAGEEVQEEHFNKEHFNKMSALLWGSGVDLDPHRVVPIAEEILRLHAAFCRFFEIEPNDGRIHLAGVRSRLGQQFLKVAHRSFYRGDGAGARELQMAALRFHRPLVLTRSFAWLSLKLLLGPRLVDTARRFGPWPRTRGHLG